MDEVNKVSSNPTIERAKAYGAIIFTVSKVNGTFGIRKFGNVCVIAPRSPTVFNFTSEKIEIVVSTIIAINGAGITLINRGNIYTINKVMPTNTYVIVGIPIKCGT